MWMIRIGLQSDRPERTDPGLRAGVWIETYKDLAPLDRRVATEGPTNDLSGAPGGFSVRSRQCWPPCRCANIVQTRSNGDSNFSGQPFVTIGGGAFPLPRPAQPETLTATRVAIKAMSTLFIGSSPFYTPRDAHFVPRCTVGRPLPSMVHCLRGRWATSKGIVSWGTQLGVR